MPAKKTPAPPPPAAKGKGPGTAVAKRAAPSNAVAAFGELPEELRGGFVATEGHGFTKDDLQIPFLRVLQKGHDQVNKRVAEKYIPGAEAGMLWNTATNQTWDAENGEGVLFVPVVYTPSYTEWKPDRGGFVKDHGPNAAIMSQTTRVEDGNRRLDVLPNGNVIQYAMQFYGFVVAEDGTIEADVAFPLTATQLKKARTLNGLIQGLRVTHPETGAKVNPKMYMRAYRISTVFESNDLGDWMGVRFAPGPFLLPFDEAEEVVPNGVAVAMRAMELERLFTAGRVKVQHEEVVDAEVVDDGVM